MAIIAIIVTIKLLLLIIIVAIIRRNAHHLPHSLHGVGWGGVGMLTFPGHVPSTMQKMLMLRSHGVGWGGVGMLTFLRPRSLDLAQDVDATLTWGGVGWGC